VLIHTLGLQTYRIRLPRPFNRKMKEHGVSERPLRGIGGGIKGNMVGKSKPSHMGDGP
jgi:hypothetical protein